MKVFIKENWGKLAIGIPVIIALFGLMINNNSLVSYGIVSIDAFQIRAIYIGTVFIGILFLIMIIYLVDSDIVVLEKMNPKSFIYKTFYKTIVLADILIILLADKTKDIYIFRFLVPDILLRIYTGFLSFLIAIVMINMDELRGEIDGKKTKTLKSFCKVMFFIIILHILIHLNSDFDQSISICIFFFSIFSTFVIANLGRYEVRYRRIENKDYKPFSIVDRNKVPSRVDLVIAFMFFCVSLICLTISYQSIYKYIPYQYGGGKMDNIEVILLDKTIVNGKYILGNEQYLYIQSSNKIFQLKKDVVKSFEIIK